MRGRPAVKATLALSLLAVLLAALLGGRSLGLSLVTVLVRAEYPAVRWLTPTELAGERPGPLLLDVREEREFAVSHLAGARRLEPGAPIPLDVLALPRDTLIVAYCAVGRRSAQAVKTLQAAGFTNVRNLDGAIFRWANEGRPLVNDGGPTVSVHPYSWLWGALLPAAHRARP
ncbi:MAG: rhodanese-like domain-containing protein [Gemmatimonadota bacterium]|nr:rhodanese-like domain-containing protein [Gemmatimonadota bacterium]